MSSLTQASLASMAWMADAHIRVGPSHADKFFNVALQVSINASPPPPAGTQSPASRHLSSVSFTGLTIDTNSIRRLAGGRRLLCHLRVWSSCALRVQ